MMDSYTSPEADPRRSRKIRRGLILAAIAIVAATLWSRPAGGTSCSEIERCRAEVQLQVGQLSTTGDWVPQPAGLTLSPDRSEVAVVLWNHELGEHRLAVFSTSTGELLDEFRNGDFAFNPVYSNDGRLLAAATGMSDQNEDRDENRDIVSGQVTVWERDSGSVNRTLFEWDLAGVPFRDWQDDPEQTEGRNANSQWRGCVDEIGFSNDALFLTCEGEFFPAVHLQGSETVQDDAYAPGFNTLAAGERYIVGRVIYDPEFNVSASVSVRRSRILIRPRSQLAHELDIGIQDAHWNDPTAALRGDDTQAAVTQVRATEGIRAWLPRMLWPAGELYLIDLTGEEPIRIELDIAPAVGRYDLSGETYALLGYDHRLLLFDAAPQG